MILLIVGFILLVVSSFVVMLNPLWPELVGFLFPFVPHMIVVGSIAASIGLMRSKIWGLILGSIMAVGLLMFGGVI